MLKKIERLLEEYVENLFTQSLETIIENTMNKSLLKSWGSTASMQLKKYKRR